MVRSIKKLKVLGHGFDLIKVGSVSYIRSVPGELSTDTNKILELAHVSASVDVVISSVVNLRFRIYA